MRFTATTSASLARTTGFVGAALALAIGAAPVLGKGPSSPANSVAILDDRREEPTVLQNGVRIGLDSGMPRALYNVNHPVDPADPETMARQFLAASRDRLRLENVSLEDLVVRATRVGPAGTVVRFEQRYQGIPVLAPDLAVTIDPNHRVTYVANGVVPGIALASVAPTVAESAARAAAFARLGVEGPLAHEAMRLVVVPGEKSARLAWQWKAVPGVQPIGDWEVLVDARTAEIFRVVNNALHVNGTGFTFDPDPLSSAQVAYGGSYVDGNDATNALLDAQRASRTLLDITDLGGGTYKLQGPYAQIVDVESPFKGLFTQGSTTFNFDRFQDGFEAAHTYYHVDQIMRYINTTLGVPLTPHQYAGGVRFDPHGLSGSDNSHYTSSNGVIAFGEGGVDDAEDADVVIHELGHGIHDWLTSGGLSQVNGLSEGTGDYVAQSYSRSLGQWPPNAAAYHWVFNWDGHNPFWAGRITNYGALYPGGLVGQVHTDGQIWSTCLMRIWDEVGRENADRAVFEGLAMTNSSTNQNDAAQAVLQAAVALGYSGADIASFASNFQQTGYTVSVGVDNVGHALVTDDCASGNGDGNGIAEPGETVAISVSLRAAALMHTGVSGVLSTTTSGVTILDGNATWPNLVPGVVTPSNAPHFLVQLDASAPCFSEIDFDLVVTSNEGGPFPSSFAQVVGQSLEPVGLPLSIPDNLPAGITNTLAIGQNVALTDVNVRVQITHTYVGDIFVKLRSPLGTEVVLLDRPGFPATTFGCGDDNMNVTFDDAAAQVLESYCSGSNPWYSGAAKAVGLLSAFNGQSSQGNWVITVSDNAGSDLGSLVDWELITTPAIGGSCDPCEGATGAPIAMLGGGFALEPSRPNPFQGSTEISFTLVRAARTTLRVHDVAGRVVQTLVDGELPAGAHAVTWNGDTGSGRAAAGVYFLRLTSGENSAIRRVQLVR